MSRPEWPPSRMSNESADAWMSRLESDIKAQHSRWVDKLAHGDESAMDIVLRNILPPPVYVESEDGSLSTMPDEDVSRFVDFLLTENMTFMEEVRNGDPDAVNDYIAVSLEMMQYNTSRAALNQPPEI